MKRWSEFSMLTLVVRIVDFDERTLAEGCYVLRREINTLDFSNEKEVSIKFVAPGRPHRIIYREPEDGLRSVVFKGSEKHLNTVGCVAPGDSLCLNPGHLKIWVRNGG